MTGFEPQTSEIESGRSTNWATTTAPEIRKVCASNILENSIFQIANYTF